MRNLAIAMILVAGVLAAWSPDALADDAAPFSLRLGFPQQDEPKPDAPAAGQAQEEPLNDIVDFEHIELQILGGVLVFGSDFDSDPKAMASLLARAPLPLLSRDLFGLETDDFGGFLQVGISAIDRETDPVAEDPDGILFFAALGLDFTAYQDEMFLVRPQVGIQFAYLGGVTETDNGVGLLLGVQGGVLVTDNIWITANPQLGIGDGGDLLFFAQIGVNIAF